MISPLEEVTKVQKLGREETLTIEIKRDRPSAVNLIDDNSSFESLAYKMFKSKKQKLNSSAMKLDLSSNQLILNPPSSQDQEDQYTIQELVNKE